MDELAQTEKLKYETLWTKLPAYRECSPGEDLAPFFLEIILKAKESDGETLIDFGCGSGRSSRVFLEAGLNLELIDFAPSALDPGIRALVDLLPERCRFWQSCLWNLPNELPVAEWGYCCDVMEHIPPTRVDAVLQQIARHVARCVFFTISFEEDLVGATIQQTLHLTIKPLDWWQDKLERAFERVECLLHIEEKYALFVCYPCCCC